LKYPSEFSLTIATSVYQIFETVTSEPFEFSFRKPKNKKRILKSPLLELFKVDKNICSTCSGNRLTLHETLITTWINILLKINQLKYCRQKFKNLNLAPSPVP
jgi:hypothetical protein